MGELPLVVGGFRPMDLVLYVNAPLFMRQKKKKINNEKILDTFIFLAH